MNKKRQIRVVVIAMLLTMVIATLYWLPSRPKRHALHIFLPDLVSPNELRQVQFSIDGKLTESQRTVMPHTSFGSGKDVYRFEGDITFEGRTVQLGLDNYKPIAMFVHSSRHYLLTRCAFAHCDSYRWFRWVPNECWEPHDISSDPTVLWLIRLGDSDEYCQYHGWLLWHLAESKQEARMFECFSALHSNDPRFVYACSDAHEGRISYFLDDVRDHQRVEFFPILVDILEQSRLGDNPQMIQMVCTTIHGLKPEEGRDVLCRFRSRIKQAANPRENRLNSLGSSYFRSIGCKME